MVYLEKNEKNKNLLPQTCHAERPQIHNKMICLIVLVSLSGFVTLTPLVCLFNS